MLNEFHVLTVESLDILLHIPTSRIFKIDHLTKEVCKYYKEGISNEDIVKKLESKYSSEQVSKVINEISFINTSNKTVNVINPVSEDEFKIENICLNIAEACNLSCDYCYAKQGNYGYGDKFMSWEVAKAAIDMVVQHKNCSEYCLVCFFGGEPLLNYSLLERVTLYAEEQFAAHGKIARFAVTTNGTLLNSLMIKFFNKHRFGIQISIDGPKVIHDRYRRFRNGRGSYQKTVNNLQELLVDWKKSLPKANIGGEATITPMDPDPYKIVSHLEKLELPNINIVPVSVPFANQDWKFHANSLAKYKISFQYLVKSLKESLKTGDFCHIEPIVTLLKMINERQVKRYPCGAGRLFFTVSADGYLYPCHRLVYQKGYCMGSVFGGVDEELRLQMLSRHVDKKMVCSSCWARYFCGGGCPGEQFGVYGSDERPVSWRCDIFKHELKWCIWLYTMTRNYKTELLKLLYND
jgi:uncharacterized protein